METEYDLVIPCRKRTTLYVDHQKLIISKANEEEVIPIAKIQSFSVSGPKGFECDRIIRFFTAQSSTTNIHWGFGISSQHGAERVFRVREEDAALAERLQEIVIGYLSDSKTENVPPLMTSIGDELRELKTLLDDGIISEEEFAAKKKQLLEL